jgi:hypothetical protein
VAYFGASSPWNTPDGTMSFLTRAETEAFPRGFDLLDIEEEDHHDKTKFGELKYWHFCPIIARKPLG